MRNEQDRPVHQIHDVVTGATTIVPITDDEWDELDARIAAAQQQELDRLQEARSLAAQVSAHPDQLVRLLAEKAGLA